MSKHTPGPWSPTFNTGAVMQGYSQPHGVVGAGEHRLKIICGCFGDIGGEDIAAANARLIAAAPELLEALKDVLHRIEESEEWWMDCPDRGGFDTEVITAAITKATGEN